MTPLSKYRFAIIMIVIIFVIVILIILNNAIRGSLNNNSNPEGNPEITGSLNPTITRVPLNKLKTANELPTLVPERGQGIDINSPQVQSSTTSIEKLSRALPYSQNITTSQGLPIEILIPPITLQENNWTLTVHIFGPDYQIPESDQEYEKMRNAFLDGASEVIQFIQLNDVSTDDIIVQWGDRAFIQERSNEWLQE